MRLKELQTLTAEVIDKIDNKRKCKHDVDTTIVHLLEEIGEVAREIMNQKIKRGKINRKNMEGEFADVAIMLMQLANNFGIDMEKVVSKKLEKMKERFGV